MNGYTKACIVLFGAALSACAPEPQSEEGMALTLRSDLWEDALNAGDIDRLLELYTENARVLPPNAELRSGREAVREEFGAMIAAGLGGELTSIEARQAADIGYNVGLYSLAGDDGEAVDRGKFIEIWRRGDDGQWRIANDIWNSDMPAAEADSAPPERHATMTIVHEVDDPDTWLAAWRGEQRRAQFRANGAAHVHVFQDPDNPNRTGLVVSLADADAFEAFLASDEARAAASEDTVNFDSLRVYREVDAP